MTNIPTIPNINRFANIMESARLALYGIRAISEVLQKDMLDCSRAEGYEPFSLSAREGLTIAVDILSESAYDKIEDSGFHAYTDEGVELNLVKNATARAAS